MGFHNDSITKDPNFMTFTNQSDLRRPFCVAVLLETIPKTNIRYFDIVLLIPSALFLVFLLFTFRKICRNRLTVNSSIIFTFYILLFLACGSKVTRALIAIAANRRTEWTKYLDKTLWLIMRFFLLATEMSIVTFGIAAARLDSRSGVKRVLIITSIISLTYTAIQAVLEFTTVDKNFPEVTLYKHGGALFLFISSCIFFMVYLLVIVIPFTQLAQRYRLPTKKSFYLYCILLASMYLVEAICSILLFTNHPNALCGIDFLSVVYFTLYDPLVYVTFLYPYFRRRRMLTVGYYQEYPDPLVDNNFNKYSGSVNNAENYSSDTPNPRDTHQIVSSNNSSNQNQHLASNQIKPLEEFTGIPYYPDNQFVVDRFDYANQPNLQELMQEFNILPTGAQMDCSIVGCRLPSSTIGSDCTNYADIDYQDRSTIVSLCEEDCVDSIPQIMTTPNIK